VFAGNRHGAILRSAPQLTDFLKCGLVREVKAPGRFQEVVTERLPEFVEKSGPTIGVLNPLGPLGLEVILDLGREVPECHRPRRIEDFSTSLRGHGEDKPRLGEEVGLGESSTQRHLTEPAQHAPGVPPSRLIHLAEPRHEKTQLEKAIDIQI
jgi:hypothetical protein